ncbi:MAG: hydrogenase formation protein HypD, partial [Ilumatobacteraceae bacterium]
MKYIDEFRDPVAAKKILGEIERLAATQPHRKFMEICGGHTHAIYRHGLGDLLPESIELVHGPGCPVCVIPMGRVDDALHIALQPDVIFCCFGDMLRVPSGKSTLLEARAEGADIRVVYSPLDALAIASKNPDRNVVFLAVGFETTAPSTAVT